MNRVGTILDFPVFQLDKSFAEKHQTTLLELINLIPLVEHTPENILAEKKSERIFYGKWTHSLVVLKEETPIAVLFSYERTKENNVLYPENSIYVSELAVAQPFQKRAWHELWYNYLLTVLRVFIFYLVTLF